MFMQKQVPLCLEWENHKYMYHRISALKIVTFVSDGLINHFNHIYCLMFAFHLQCASLLCWEMEQSMCSVRMPVFRTNKHKKDAFIQQ